MSIVLSIYKVESAFREEILMDQDAGEKQIQLDRHLFRLNQDIKLKLVKTERFWKLIADGYKICENNKLYYPETAIRDGLNVSIINGPDKITLMAYERAEPFSVYEKYHIVDRKVITVGSSTDNTICYKLIKDDPKHDYVSAHEHCRIEILDNQAFVTDDSKNGTFVNFARVPRGPENRVRLNFGDSIRIFQLNIIYLGDMLAIHAREGATVNLKPFTKDEIGNYMPFGSFQAGNEVEEFHRAPRIMPKLHTDTVEIEAPPMLQQDMKMSVFATVGPAFTMAIPMLISGAFTIWASRQSGNAASLFMYTGIVMALASACIGVLWAVVNMNNQKKRAREYEEKRQSRYREYLAKIWDRLESDREENRRNLNLCYIDAAACCEMNAESERLWNRNSTHSDFMSYRIGIGTIDFQEPIVIPKERFTMLDDQLAEQPRVIQENFRKMSDAPVLLDLRKEHIIGLAGGISRREAVKAAHSLIAQIVTANCYTDVKIALVYDGNDDIDRDAWEFMKWFPHVWSEDRKIRYIATNQDEMGDIFFEMSQVFRHRIDEKRYTGGAINRPQYILIVSNPRLIEGSIISTYIFERDKDIGLSTVFISDAMRNLPNDCECIIDCQNGVISHTGDGDGSDMPVKLDRVNERQLLNLAKTLGNIRVTEAGDEGEIPSMLSFFDMYNISSPEGLEAQKRWRNADPAASLRALIGYKSGNRPCYLDLNEKYHGPHGLVAGTTGSGKSETLQTYILSLAASFSPEDVGFFIIDYKGGGMANLFRNLPHLVGSISNLSGNQVRRAMVSINSEITRRQRLFNEYGVNKIDAYTAMFKNHEAAEPLPHLLIIIDEFAEMKKELPDFMRELISVAQVGRSLGIHLILATQRPSGAVDGNIWANSRFKLCLRVQNREDSMDMLHKPDAAFLTQTGRCYLQVGTDEVYELFQSGWSGASYDKELGGRSTLLAQMLSASGKVDLVGNIARVRLKEKKQIQWIEELVGILEETGRELNADICSKSFSFLSQAEFGELFYEKVRDKHPEFEKSQFNSMRIDDFIKVYRIVKESDAQKRDVQESIPERISKEAMQRRIHLPELKPVTQLETVVDYLQRVARENGVHEVRKLWLPPLGKNIYLSRLGTFIDNTFDGVKWPECPGRFQLQAVVGYGDAPENQAQMDVGIDFANGMHHMVCGIISSGKSTFVQTAVYSLCMTYSPMLLNVYLLDFSAQMLTVFDGLPHVGGIITENDLETDRIPKFFMLLRKIMAERKALLGSYGSNFSDYINHRGWSMPAILIVIDNYGGFREKTQQSYDNEIMKIVKEGIGYGIFLMLTGNGVGMNDIPNRLADSIKTGICLEMNEVYDYQAILRCGKPEVLPEPGTHGRGLIWNNENVIEFQTALAAESEDGPERNDLIREKVRIMKDSWIGPTARQIPRIPENPVREEFIKMPGYAEILSNHRFLPVGYNYEDADVYAFDLAKNYMFLVTGARGTGKSVFMKNIILTCLDREEECLVVERGGTVFSRICEENSLRRAGTAEEIAELMRYVYNVMHSRIAHKNEILKSYIPDEEMFEKSCENRRMNIFIADLNKFLGELYDSQSPAYNTKATFEVIAEKGALYNIFLFAEVRDADQTDLKNMQVMTEVREQCLGMRFGGKFDDRLDLVSFANIGFRERAIGLDPGYGVVASESSNSKIEKFVVPMYRG